MSSQKLTLVSSLAKSSKLNHIPNIYRVLLRRRPIPLLGLVIFSNYSSCCQFLKIYQRKNVTFAKIALTKRMRKYAQYFERNSQN